MRLVIAAMHRRRQLVHLVQHAVDAEAHQADLAPRLDVDVARALVEGVLPQPVDDVDDVLVVRVELAVRLAELDQLLEVRQARARLGGALRALDRLREVVELDHVALDVERVGDHALDLDAVDALELRLPLADVRLGGGDHRLLAGRTSTGRILKRSA